MSGEKYSKISTKIARITKEFILSDLRSTDSSFSDLAVSYVKPRILLKSPQQIPFHIFEIKSVFHLFRDNAGKYPEHNSDREPHQKTLD